MDTTSAPTIDDLRTKYASSVALGASFLDAMDHDWFARIDKATLAFPSLNECVLGQLLGSYQMGLEKLRKGQELDWSRLHGFTLHPQDLDFDNQNWRVLTELWLAEVVRREGAL
ncbi:hypothetical protein [Nonomuraea typhae]|uniref:Uncharacterized protein n=1 Tax=Nonomuraea typhae TaxID=2603600 RepID=A0ABW7YKZ9_9ACTN